MDLNHLISLKIILFLLAVLAVHTSGQICSAPLSVEFPENNDIGDVVTNINTQEGVSLELLENPYSAFGINGTSLVANIVLDYETLPPGGGLSVSIRCTKVGEGSITIRVFVVVQNINDNSPVFAQNLYSLNVDELSKVGTSVGKIEATDLDGDRLYYRLVSPMDEFGLQADTNPEIVVKKILDYDTIKEVTLNLFAQDTPLASTETLSHTATTTVTVTIIDINNRPPWFQPCTESALGTTKVCITSGYSGNINLNQQTAGDLTLKPGPVYAIDGDNGRNDPIRYTIIGGNVNDTFNINEITGSITMQKAFGLADPIVLIVMAYELENPDQFATTTVTLNVVISSSHPPQFVKSTYEGFISVDTGVGSLVLESKSGTKPLQVQATDADFADGVNPSIAFEVPLDSDFKITSEGYIVMTKVPSPGNVNMQITVVDATNHESSTASLSVEVTPGVTTTDMFTTTNRPTTTAMTPTMATSTELTTKMPTSTELTTKMPTSTELTTKMPTSTELTTKMATSTELTTNKATETAAVTNTPLTESTAGPHTIPTNPDTTTRSPYTEGLPLPSGDFRMEDMVALGVSLAVALLICFVVIGVLVYNLRRFNADWKKLSEASIFRSSLSGGSGGPKDGVQYTNEGFQADEDTDSVTSKQAAETPLPPGPELSRSVPEALETQRSAPAMQSKSSDDNSTVPTDSSSLNASDSTDNEKEVKPILTKERRMEDGYKAVWFKEDIDPNDKQEMVISDREQDIDHEDDDHDHDDDDDDDDDEEEEEEDSNFSEL